LTRFDLPPPPPGILERSNEEVMEAFLAALAAAGASPKTLKAYRAAISDFLAWLGGRRLAEVSSSDVAAWVYERLTRGLRRPRGEGTDSRRERQVTMHYYTLFLRSFFEWLGLPVRVPVVKKPRGRRVEALTGEEVWRLLAAARDALDFLIVALLFETGLRAQEAVGLRLRDIDFARREIRVRNAKYGEERIVLYGDLTEQALRLWLSLNPGLGPDDPLLGISYSGLYKRLKSLARRAGVDPRKVRPHVLRHTFATEALRRGVPLPVVQRLLGHHDIKVTQVYLHLVNEDVRRAYQQAFAAPQPAPPAGPAAPPPYAAAPQPPGPPAAQAASTTQAPAYTAQPHPQQPSAAYPNWGTAAYAAAPPGPPPAYPGHPGALYYPVQAATPPQWPQAPPPGTQPAAQPWGAAAPGAAGGDATARGRREASRR